MKLLIDDQREGNGYDVICRNANSAKKVIRLFDSDREAEYWDEIAFDHDLGLGSISGYDLMKVLFSYFDNIPAKQIRIVTSNPVGRRNMENLLKDNGYSEVTDNHWGYMVWKKG